MKIKQLIALFIFQCSLAVSFSLYADIHVKPHQIIEREDTILIGEQKNTYQSTKPGNNSAYSNDYCMPDAYEVVPLPAHSPGKHSKRAGRVNSGTESSTVQATVQANSLSLPLQQNSFVNSYRYSTNDYNVGADVCEAYSGGFVLCGGTAADVQNNSSIFLMKIDNSGTHQTVFDKVYTISGSFNSIALGICRAPGNCYYVTGAYDLDDPITPKGFLFKVDANLNIVGNTTLISEGFGVGVLSSIDGGCVVSGIQKKGDIEDEPSRVFVKKFDSGMSPVWPQAWIHSNNSSEGTMNESWAYTQCLLEVPAGYYGEGNVILGYTHNDGVVSHEFLSSWLVCLDGTSGKLESEYPWNIFPDPNDPNPV